MTLPTRLTLSLALLLAAVTAWPPGPAIAADPASEEAGDSTSLRPHELGWVCLNVSDTRIAQISAFNRDSPSLSVWVAKERFHIEEGQDGPGGRVCIPTIVKLGEVDLPENTLVFERELFDAEGVRQPAVAELVLKPEDKRLAEATVTIASLPEQWANAAGTWTFSYLVPLRFEAMPLRGLLGEGEGPDPASVFTAAPVFERFEEPCTPVELTMNTVGYLGRYDAATNRVHARGVEPFKLHKGDVVSRCEGLAADGTTLAVAKRLAPEEIGWFVIPRESEMKTLDPDVRFLASKPLGGYHACRQPTWNSTLLEAFPLDGAWELNANGRWDRVSPGLAPEPLPAGYEVTVLNHKDTWALVRLSLGGVPRTFALPGRVVAMPSGPASEVRTLAGGLCQWPRGQWRAIAAETQAFKVSQEAPGAELAGLWLKIPHGTRVLSLCASDDKRCEPIYVGGSQSKETDRMVLVLYSGRLMAVRELDLREHVSGVFATRRERPRYWRAEEDPIVQTHRGWAVDLGPGARLSFAEQDHFGWTTKLRAQNLDADLGFEGWFGVGGDGLSTFLELGGGIGTLFWASESGAIELRGAALFKLDFRTEGSGGLGFDVIAKGQLRWVNDFTPISFEVGVNLGYGGTFGDGGDSGVTFGIPLWLTVQLVSF